MRILDLSLAVLLIGCAGANPGNSSPEIETGESTDAVPPNPEASVEDDLVEKPLPLAEDDTPGDLGDDTSSTAMDEADCCKCRNDCSENKNMCQQKKSGNKEKCESKCIDAKIEDQFAQAQCFMGCTQAADDPGCSLHEEDCQKDCDSFCGDFECVVQDT